MTPDLDSYWRATYPECPPIPSLLRDAYCDRWVRFHSLPNSKRYANDESEYQILLHRHNSVLAELASPREQLVFVSTGYSESSEPVRGYEVLNEIDPNPHCWRTLARHQLDNDEDNPNYWHLFMSVSPWTTGCFDPILRLVADDVVANTMIVSTTNDWIYHPYDGGADVILSTTEDRNQLTQVFKLWLSPRRDGL